MGARADAVETSPLVDSLVQLSFTVHDVLTRAAAECNLSVTQLRLLGILRDRTPAMTAIADHLGLDRSSVTGLVDRAQERGLVSRATATHDARVTIVRATAQGVAVGRKLAAKVSDEIEALVRHIPRTERESLVRVAASILGPDDNRRSATAAR